MRAHYILTRHTTNVMKGISWRTGSSGLIYRVFKKLTIHSNIMKGIWWRSGSFVLYSWCSKNWLYTLTSWMGYDEEAGHLGLYTGCSRNWLYKRHEGDIMKKLFIWAYKRGVKNLLYTLTSWRGYDEKVVHLGLCTGFSIIDYTN